MTAAPRTRAPMAAAPATSNWQGVETSLVNHARTIYYFIKAPQEFLLATRLFFIRLEAPRVPILPTPSYKPAARAPVARPVVVTARDVRHASAHPYPARVRICSITCRRPLSARVLHACTTGRAELSARAPPVCRAPPLAGTSLLARRSLLCREGTGARRARSRLCFSCLCVVLVPLQQASPTSEGLPRNTLQCRQLALVYVPGPPLHCLTAASRKWQSW